MSDEVRCWCKHCGYELDPSHTGNCPKCKQRGKECEVHVRTAIGISARATVSVTHALDASERPLWLKLVKFLKENVVIDGFEIGFPSGIKVIFKVKNKQ